MTWQTNTPNALIVDSEVLWKKIRCQRTKFSIQKAVVSSLVGGPIGMLIGGALGKKSTPIDVGSAALSRSRILFSK